MAEKKKKQPEEGKSSGGKLKLIILIVLVLLVLGGGGGAAYYFLVLDKNPDTAEATEEGGEGAAESKSEEGQSAAAPAPVQAPLIYHPLDPITVNITAPGSVRFLRVNMTIVTRNERVIVALDKHMPMIRNDLLSHLGSQDAAAINTQQGKDALREELRSMISGILTRSAEPSDIVNILFTDLVMQ